MSQKRLNHVMILHTHKQQTDDLDLYKIAKEFASANSQRQDFLDFSHMLLSHEEHRIYLKSVILIVIV